MDLTTKKGSAMQTTRRPSLASLKRQFDGSERAQHTAERMIAALDQIRDDITAIDLFDDERRRLVEMADEYAANIEDLMEQAIAAGYEPEDFDFEGFE